MNGTINGEAGKHWRLNGTTFPFRGLTEDRIQKLRHVATMLGVECFESDELPRGTMELWNGRHRIAVITGVKKG